jgi:1D-myo-inositol-tetrakisphosphate 5-kinase/inositol-polyphosphate multikinase
VGGHANGVFTTEDDSLLIKQAFHLELKFYQTVQTATTPEFDALRPFIPKFLGTLALQGEVDPDKPLSETSINVKPVAGARKDESHSNAALWAPSAYWIEYNPSF